MHLSHTIITFKMSITTSTAATGGHKPDDIPTAATPSSANIDLVSCTPDELSAWLLKHRFEVSAQDVSCDHTIYVSMAALSYRVVLLIFLTMIYLLSLLSVTG